MMTTDDNSPIITDDGSGEPVIEPVDESSSKSSEIKKPFDPKRIDITYKSLIIDSLIKRMRDPMRIDLKTEFQRSADLWKPQEQSRLIESLLVRIPLPAFYFDGTDDNNWKVVDGLQRLCSLKNFVIDKKFELQGLEYLSEFNGHGFRELPGYLQTRIEETPIVAYIINPGTPDNVKYNIFKRINTGGLVLTPQEIRHALNQGIPSNFVKELADMDEFHQATGNNLKDKHRMEDRDFVTRYLGFYHGYLDYKPDLDEFLNAVMRNLKDEERGKIKEDFAKSMTAAYNIFGAYAFRKRNIKNERRKPLNKALFDSISVNLAWISEENIRVLVSNKNKVEELFIQLVAEEPFYNAITFGTGDYKAIQTRIEAIKELFMKVISQDRIMI